ncbi:MAG: hypothetical protein DCF29_09415 [Alphaproteobacteria bacterium]|nr:MAG: hypothetical protein DCF29_09415 [Alphaproteobacteria bacterium]
MTILNIEWELPQDDGGRGATLLGRNVDGTMLWTVEAGRDNGGPISQISDLTTEQLIAVGLRVNAFLDGRV